MPESKKRKYFAEKKYTPMDGACDDCDEPFTCNEGLSWHIPICTARQDQFHKTRVLTPAYKKNTRKADQDLNTSTSSPPYKKSKDTDVENEIDVEDEIEQVLNSIKDFLQIYGISNKLETCQVLLFFFLPQKDQFWFLLMLKISAA